MSEKTWQMTNKYFTLNFIFVFHNGLGKSFFFLQINEAKKKLMLIRFMNYSYGNEINVSYTYIHLGENKTDFYLHLTTYCVYALISIVRKYVCCAGFT